MTLPWASSGPWEVLLLHPVNIYFTVNRKTKISHTSSYYPIDLICNTKLKECVIFTWKMTGFAEMASALEFLLSALLLFPAPKISSSSSSRKDICLPFWTGFCFTVAKRSSSWLSKTDEAWSFFEAMMASVFEAFLWPSSGSLLCVLRREQALWQRDHLNQTDHLQNREISLAWLLHRGSWQEQGCWQV